jgi:lipopolysaccharide export system protein LptC
MSKLKFRLKQPLAILCSIAILLLSAWHLHLSSESHFNPAVLSKQIDMSISQLQVRQYNSEGQLVNQLITPLMQHLSKEDFHLLQNPHVFITKGKEPAWEISALEARSFEGGKYITFTKQVLVHQNSGKTSQESTLKTEEITYYPLERKATTPLFVSFEQAGNVMQSIGMNAYLDEKRVELLHRARGRYEPARA